MNEDQKYIGEGLEGRDCVPFFTTDKGQIIFEFFYLIVIFFIACSSMLILQLYTEVWGISHPDKQSLFALIGGKILTARV